MKEATSIIIHSENNTAVKCLTNEQAGILFKGILEYSSSGMPLESTDTALQALFSMFKVQIDRDFKKYSDRCEQNRLNALRRHQNSNNRLSRIQAKATVCHCKRTHAKITIIVMINVKVKIMMI